MRLLLFLIIEVAVLAITLVSFAAQRGSSINASQSKIDHSIVHARSPATEKSAIAVFPLSGKEIQSSPLGY